MELVLALAVFGAVNIFCFVIGAKVGQQVTKGETVKLPSVNPVKAYRAYEARKEAEHEQDKLDTILSNLESYDGTGSGQREVPKG